MNDSRYHRSEEMLARALKTIPLGAQTFSKSATQFPFGVSPYFIQRGLGSRIWDVDGNEYVDFANALCAVTLGYCDPDIDGMVRQQLEDGVIFSLSHPMEIDVAEALVEVIPCAEKVRFGKNGSDATAGAVRVARAFTGRDRVAVAGYHGWQDWYIGSTARNLGVPEATRALTHRFPFNDIDALHRLLREHPGEFAAVILEPLNAQLPAPGFLEAVRELATAEGVVLIFDETITGFRVALGGAQELYGVTPDLATFGKGLANGYPVSAVVGRSDIMKLMEEVFFSFTFGGEALSLAAAKGTIAKLRDRTLLASLADMGQKVIGRLRAIIEREEAGSFLHVSGHPSWSFLNMSDTPELTSFELKTLFMQEMLARGILTYGTHNMSCAHSDEDIELLFAAYSETIPIMCRAVREGQVRPFLRCEPLVPLFKIR